MSNRKKFWTWLNECPFEWDVSSDEMDCVLVLFGVEDDEELEIVFEPEEDTGLDFNKAIKLVVDNDE